MAKKYYGGESGEPRRRVRYMMLGNAVLAGSAEPAVAPPSRRKLKAMPKGSNLVGNLGSLFDIAETGANTGLNVIFAPRRTGKLIDRGFRKDYERARKETRQSFIEPIFYGLEHEDIERKHKQERNIRNRQKERVMDEQRQVYEETLKNRPYNPQIIKSMGYASKGKKPRSDQNIKTDYKREGFYNKPEKNYSLDVSPTINFSGAEPDTTKMEGIIRSYPKYNDTKKSSYPFKNQTPELNKTTLFNKHLPEKTYPPEPPFPTKRKTYITYRIEPENLVNMKYLAQSNKSFGERTKGAFSKSDTYTLGDVIFKGVKKVKKSGEKVRPHKKVKKGGK